MAQPTVGSILACIKRNCAQMWTNDSEVKSSCCWRFKFDSQHSQGSSQLFITPVPGYPTRDLSRHQSHTWCPDILESKLFIQIYVFVKEERVWIKSVSSIPPWWLLLFLPWLLSVLDNLQVLVDINPSFPICLWSWCLPQQQGNNQDSVCSQR